MLNELIKLNQELSDKIIQIWLSDKPAEEKYNLVNLVKEDFRNKLNLITNK